VRRERRWTSADAPCPQNWRAPPYGNRRRLFPCNEKHSVFTEFRSAQPGGTRSP
jgi:hypothetical protein